MCQCVLVGVDGFGFFVDVVALQEVVRVTILVEMFGYLVFPMSACLTREASSYEFAYRCVDIIAHTPIEASSEQVFSYRNDVRFEIGEVGIGVVVA